VPFIEDILTQSDIAYGTGMRNLVAEVCKEAEADAKQTAELQKAADAAVKEKMERSERDLWVVWDRLQVNEEVNQVAFWNAYRQMPDAPLTPERLPLWEEALKTVLRPEQYAKWEQLAAERRGRIDKAVAAYIEKRRSEWVTKRTETRVTYADSISKSYGLTEEQTTALRQGISEVVEQAGKSWGSAVELQLREYLKTAFLGAADERLQAVENAAMNFGNDTDETTMEQEEKAWSALVGRILDAGQLQQYQVAEKARMERRLRSLARVVVAEVDRKVLLTAQQRSQLEPLLKDVVADHALKLEGLLSQSYVNSEMLLGVVSLLDEQKVKPILDQDQWDGWREASMRMAYYFGQ
jgi:hypothetical protein